jgi:1-acyl-sn-glycerol-3-phosphate acyltransferase
MSLLALPSRLSLSLLGWEVTDRPKERKFVGLAWPHSSNLDGLLMVMMAAKMDLTMSWMVKDAVNKPVLGEIVRRVGGVFIDRSKAHGVVQQMVDEFSRRDEFALMVPPEGTRSYRDYWKSGFYHIAVGAKVPIVPAFLDFGKKRAGFGPAIMPTGDVHVDMDTIRAFYEPMDAKGFRNELVGPIRLREEEKSDA